MRRFLCLGAHSDDIEIGTGGTLLKLAGEIPDLEICWVVFSALGARAEEAGVGVRTPFWKVYSAKRFGSDRFARATSQVSGHQLKSGMRKLGEVRS